MHCRDATYSRKITLIIFHRIIAWKKTTRLNTIPIMFVMLRYCWLQIYSYFDQGCRKKCTRQSRKGIVGGFEGTVLQRNLKEWYRKPQTYVYEYSRKATKVACVAWQFCRAGRRSGVATKNSRAKRARTRGEAARKIKTACPDSWPFQLPPPSTHFDILLTTCLVSVFPANQK